MLVQLLLVPDCPSAEPAAAVIRQALDEAGLSDVPVSTVIIDTQDEADRLRFLGSPTVLIDGRDPFPGPQRRPALACRLYQHQSGLRGVPPLHPIRQALRDVQGVSAV
jgi:hypothetical protein